MQGKELTQKLNEMMSSVNELNTFLSILSKRESSFYQNPNQIVHEEILVLEKRITENYRNSLEGVSSLISIVESHLISNPPQDNGTSTFLPSKEEVQSQLTNLFKGKIKTRQAPIPVNCGCYAYRVKTPNPGHFICVNVKKQFFLMIVYHYENEICRAYDPVDIDNGIKLIELTNDEWTPLPTIIPERPLARWEHSRASKVLALWPNGEDWTTAFYPAQVISRPCDQTDQEVEEKGRGYELDFGDETVFTVPEQFVVSLPESWK